MTIDILPPEAPLSIYAELDAVTASNLTTAERELLELQHQATLSNLHFAWQIGGKFLHIKNHLLSERQFTRWLETQAAALFHPSHVFKMMALHKQFTLEQLGEMTTVNTGAAYVLAQADEPEVVDVILDMARAGTVVTAREARTMIQAHRVRFDRALFSDLQTEQQPARRTPRITENQQEVLEDLRHSDPELYEALTAATVADIPDMNLEKAFRVLGVFSNLATIELLAAASLQKQTLNIPKCPHPIWEKWGLLTRVEGTNFVCWEPTKKAERVGILLNQLAAALDVPTV